MSRSVIVHVFTDHDDTDDAVRSVINGMKRAGYDYEDYRILSESEAAQSIQGFAHGLVSVSEPDIQREIPSGKASPDPTVGG